MPYKDPIKQKEYRELPNIKERIKMYNKSEKRMVKKGI